MRARALSVSALVATLAAAPQCASPPDVAPAGLAAADSLVRAWVEQGRVPGAVLVVGDETGVLLSSAYGSAGGHAYGRGQYPDGSSVSPRGIEPSARPLPMAVGTVFDLASVTKVMATTMAVAMLSDRGTLDVDAPVHRYLPDFTGGGRDAITVRHLLTHRSGLPQWHPVYAHAADADAAYAWIREVPLAWRVGAERHYSDLGFMVLGRIVERVAGAPLDAFLESELYGPLGLGQTGFRGRSAVQAAGFVGARFASTSHGNPFERRMVHDSTFGYLVEEDDRRWDGWRRYTLTGEVNDGNAHHAFGGVAGHAGLFSTAQELHELLRLLLSGGRADGRSYLGESTIDSFLAPTGDGQALGWQIPDYAPPSAFGHTGFTGTFVLGVRDTGLAVVLLTNRQNGGVDGDTGYPDVSELQRGVTLALTAPDTRP